MPESVFDIPVHPAAALFPMMEGAKWVDFVEDVRTRGLQHKITTYQGQILDGRNRLAACKEVGVQPEFVEFTGDDPVRHVISLNIQRRTLDPSQLSMLGADLKEMLKVEALKRKQAGIKSDLHLNLGEGRAQTSSQQAGEIVGVSHGLVDAATRVKRKGTPELVQAVRDGSVSVSAAAQIANETPERQRQVLAEVAATGDDAAAVAESKKIKESKRKPATLAPAAPAPDFASTEIPAALPALTVVRAEHVTPEAIAAAKATADVALATTKARVASVPTPVEFDALGQPVPEPLQAKFTAAEDLKELGDLQKQLRRRITDALVKVVTSPGSAASAKAQEVTDHLAAALAGLEALQPHAVCECGSECEACGGEGWRPKYPLAAPVAQVEPEVEAVTAECPDVDPTGRPIPEHVKPAFAVLAPFLSESIQVLQKLKRNWAATEKKLDKTPAMRRSGSHHFARTAVADGVDAAISGFKFAQPYCVCVWCLGAGGPCEFCSESGFMDRRNYDRAPQARRDNPTSPFVPLEVEGDPQ